MTSSLAAFAMSYFLSAICRLVYSICAHADHRRRTRAREYNETRSRFNARKEPTEEHSMNRREFVSQSVRTLVATSLPADAGLAHCSIEGY